MKTRFSAKGMILWGALGVAFYFLMSHHIIFFGWEPRTLDKAKLTFEDTFFSTTGMNNEQILRNDTLRRAGIGRLLIQAGRITEEELEALTARLTE